MRATCCICSDVLDEVHSVSAISCGHVYHSNCLMVWIGQCKTCPKCRTRVNDKSILKLFFDFPTTPADNNSILENQVLNLKACVSAKDIELEACRKEKDSMKAFIREAEKKAADLQQSLYESISKTAELSLKVKSTATLQSKIMKLEKMNVALTNDLQMLNNVQSIVSGTQKDVDCILQECGNGSESTKQMATYCTVLKRELQKVIDSKNKLLELNSKLKQENCRFAAKVKFYEDAMTIPNKHDNSPYGKSTHFLKQNEFASNSNSVEMNNSPVPNNQPSSSGNKISNQNDTDISPLSLPFSKSKFSMCIVASSSSSHKRETNPEIKKYTNISSVTIKKQSDDGSVIRTGYNGLGGHSNFINTSSKIKKMRSLKRKF